MSIIKIQTEKPSIPIEFGKLKFEFDISDESVQKFYGGVERIQEELTALDVVEGKEFESMKEALKKGYDFMLGDGAFDKIYEQTPSAIKLLEYFQLLSESIAEKLQGMGLTESQKTKVEKYLQNKKK